MKTLALLGLALLILSTQACKKDSSEVDPDRIKTEYSLIYDLENNQTVAQAKFSTSMFNGRTVELNQGATIRFNGVNMTYISSGTYRNTFTGLVDSGTFVFTDNLGRNFQNTLSGLRPINLPSWFNAVTRGQNMDMLWSGDAIANNEIVDLRITNTADSDSTATFTAANFGATSVFIDGNILFNQLQPGDAKVVLERYQTPALQAGTPEGGSLHLGYFTTRSINVY